MEERRKRLIFFFLFFFFFFFLQREGLERLRSISLPKFSALPPSMDAKPSLSPCDTEKLKRCLEEHGGDASKCSHLISAFKSSCGKQQQQTEKEKKEEASPPSTKTKPSPP